MAQALGTDMAIDLLVKAAAEKARSLNLGDSDAAEAGKDKKPKRKYKGKNRKGPQGEAGKPRTPPAAA